MCLGINTAAMSKQLYGSYAISPNEFNYMKRIDDSCPGNLPKYTAYSEFNYERDVEWCLEACKYNLNCVESTFQLADETGEHKGGCCLWEKSETKLDPTLATKNNTYISYKLNQKQRKYCCPTSCFSSKKVSTNCTTAK